MEIPERPILSAVSSSARQLYLLLRCIGFSSKVQVQVSEAGLRFSVQDSQVMQGFAFLEEDLFTSYQYNPPAGQSQEEQDSPAFQVSLTALLETLQIFGVTERSDRWTAKNDAYSSGIASATADSAFDNRVLGMTGVCRILYAAEGEPLCIVLEETGVSTTCELVTYEPESAEIIPFDRDQIPLKIIMRATWMQDAINELSTTSPDKLTITASDRAPYLVLLSTGPLGSAGVEFSKDPQLLETFQVSRKSTNSYRFSLVKNTAKAMAVATKVSIRGDAQGVLSMQFMIEVGHGAVSFVDFRFVPLANEDGEGVRETDAHEDESAGEQQ